MKKIAFIFLVSLVFVKSALAQEYVIIANKSMKELSLGQIKAIFLKKLSYVDDTKVVPVNLSARDALRVKFEKKILRMSLSRIKTYWTKQHYLGHRPPISLKSQESIKAFVKKVDGSLGYIEAINVDKDLKIIYKWSE